MDRDRVVRLLPLVLILALAWIALYRLGRPAPTRPPMKPIVHIPTVPTPEPSPRPEPVPVVATPVPVLAASAPVPERPPLLPRPDVGVPSAGPILKGRVSIPFPLPRRRRAMIHHHPDVTAHVERPLWREDLVFDDQGSVRWAFVWISTGVAGTFPPPEEPVYLDQEGCRYVPRVVGMMTRQELVVRNRDPVLHAAHALPFNNRPRTTGMPPDRNFARWTFPLKEIMIAVHCDVHPCMKAWVGVVPHPYFAVTDAQGRYEIKGLPAGSYTVEVWHERYRPITHPLKFDGHAVVDFTLTEKR